jgi:hypothetical protein
MIVSKLNFGIEHFKNAPLIVHPDNRGRPLDMEHFKGIHLDLERHHHLKEVLKQVLEFGVHTGRSINIIADILKDKTIHGFDSFEGLPEDWAMSNGEFHNPNTIKRKKGYFALDNLPEVRDNVRLWKGWFDKTIPQYLEDIKPQQIAFLHIQVQEQIYLNLKSILLKILLFVLMNFIHLEEKNMRDGKKMNLKH